MSDYYSEKDLEPFLREQVEQMGGVCWKFTSPGRRGVPDRIVLMPGGKIYFVELKSTGFEPRKFQKIMHRILRQLGFKVYVIDNKPDLIKFLDEIRSI